LGGERLFAAESYDSVSVIHQEQAVVSLGMDVVELYDNLGYPDFSWGRGVPAPQLQYTFGNCEIYCLLSKVVAITFHSDHEWQTSAGIAVGDTYADVLAAYDLRATDFAKKGGTLLFAGDEIVDDYATATHSLEFFISSETEKIEAITLTDIVTGRELS
jgi:hypothetical protein